MNEHIEPRVNRQLVDRMRTIISKMDEWQHIIEENNLWDEQPSGWQGSHQAFIRWLMERGG